MTSIAGESDPRTNRVLVVHGRDGAARRAMFDFLRALRLEPMEWGQLVTMAGGGSPYNGEVVAAALDSVQAVVVLFTPDEQVRLHPSLSGDKQDQGMQSRPNVILEAGMAIARMEARTLLVELGRLRPITDLDGRNSIRLSAEGGPNPLNDLATRLEQAGCPVDRSGVDWLDNERFATLEAFRRSFGGTANTGLVHAPDLRLADQLQDLASDIHTFLGDREADDPGRQPHWHRFTPEMSEEDRNEIFHEQTSKLIAYSSGTMRRFSERFQAKALAHFDRLQGLGVVAEGDRWVFEHPTNPLGIAEIATRLGVAAERLRAGAS